MISEEILGFFIEKSGYTTFFERGCGLLQRTRCPL